MTSDSELQRDARQQLVQEPGVEEEAIEVRVQDGVATLTGNVRSEAESWSAADAVRRVPGVRSLVNETMIVGETPVLPADTDADVARPWFPSN